MNDFEKKFLPENNEDQAQMSVYAFSRSEDSQYAKLLVKRGLSADGVGKVTFPSAKLDPQALVNFKLARQFLQPHPHSKKDIPDIDVDANISEIEKQNLFLGLLVERLNDAEGLKSPVENTRFMLSCDKSLRSNLCDFVSDETYETLDAYTRPIATFTICSNDGTGNYCEFAKIFCMPEQSERFKAAITDTVYNLERALKLVSASRNDPTPKAGLGDVCWPRKMRQ